MTTSSASTSRSSRSPARGIAMPSAAYSGSYQPAPSPTSRRPPLTQSSVASALASTAAGRSASSSTSVPSRTRGTARASAASVTIGSKHPSLPADPPYFARSRKRWSESQTESAPPRSAETRVLDDRLEPQGPLPRHRVVVLRQREPDLHPRRRHRARLPMSRRGGSALPARDRVRRLRAARTASRRAGVRRERFRRTRHGRAPRARPPRAARRSSTCTPMPTTTDRCSPWPGPVAATPPTAYDHSRRPWPSSARSSVTSASTRASALWTSCRSWPSTRPTIERTRAIEEARDFARLVGSANSRCRCSCTTTPTPTGAISRARARPAFASAQPDFGPALPHPRLGATAVGARRPLVACNCVLSDRDVVVARPDRARDTRAVGRAAGVRALGLRLGRSRARSGVDEPGRARPNRDRGRVLAASVSSPAGTEPTSRASSWSGSSRSATSIGAPTSSSGGATSTPARPSRPGSATVPVGGRATLAARFRSGDFRFGNRRNR